MKNCPYCAEEIQDAAVKCKHCGEMLDGSQNHSLNKIEEKTGCGTALICLIIPGSGQIVRGEIAKGIVYFVLAIGMALPTGGLGYFIVAIVSAADTQSPIYKCPNCLTTVDKKARKCKFCQSGLNVKAAAPKRESQDKEKGVDTVTERFVLIMFVIMAVLFTYWTTTLLH